MSNQPFFNSARLSQLAMYFCGAIAIAVLLGWAANHYTGIKIDWSFLVPLGGLLGALLPLATGVVGYLDKRLKENDARLDKLEVLASANQQVAEESARDRHELRKIILKLEARIESIRDERVATGMEEISQMLRELLEKKG